MNGPVTPCGATSIEGVLCKIFCRTKAEGAAFKADPANAGRRFNYSQRAKELAQTTYRSSLQALGNFVPEKSFLVSVAKSSLGNTARTVYTEAALKRRLLKEAAAQAGESAAKGAGKTLATKAALKFVPVINVLSTVYDLYELGAAGVEIYQKAEEFMKKYDTFRIRPDMAELGPDGEVKKIYDYKFDYPGGGSDRLSDEQVDLYRKKSGEVPTVIDGKTCRC